MRRLGAALWILLLLASLNAPVRAAAGAAAAAAAPTALESTLSTIVLVRHAEKNEHPAGGDTGLNTGGCCVRARLTGVPLASAIGVSVRVYDANQLEDLAKRVRAEGKGGTVVIVGHSDTIGPTIEALTGRPLGASEAAPYDRIWVLTLLGDGSFSLVRLRYGAVTS